MIRVMRASQACAVLHQSAGHQSGDINICCKVYPPHGPELQTSGKGCSKHQGQCSLSSIRNNIMKYLISLHVTRTASSCILFICILCRRWKITLLVKGRGPAVMLVVDHWMFCTRVTCPPPAATHCVPCPLTMCRYACNVGPYQNIVARKHTF